LPKALAKQKKIDIKYTGSDKSNCAGEIKRAKTAAGFKKAYANYRELID
jgi:hypothetical protein